jgi:hypothetical protein
VYYQNNCKTCHTPSTKLPTYTSTGNRQTCNGCHKHGTHPSKSKNTINVTVKTNKPVYAPGEAMIVKIYGGWTDATTNGPVRTGWVRGVLVQHASLSPSGKKPVGYPGTYQGAANNKVLYAPRTATASASTRAECTNGLFKQGCGQNLTPPLASLPSSAVTIKTKAPTTAGNYTWRAGWYGNKCENATCTNSNPPAPFIPDPNNPNHGWEMKRFTFKVQ